MQGRPGTDVFTAVPKSPSSSGSRDGAMRGTGRLPGPGRSLFDESVVDEDDLGDTEVDLLEAL